MAKKITKSAKSKTRAKASTPEKVVVKKKVPRPAVPVKSTAKVVKVKEGSEQHGMVWARAGCGKTFSQIVGIAYIFRDRKLPGTLNVKTGEANTLWGRVEKELGRWRNPSSGHWQYPDKVKKVVPSAQQKAVWEFMAQRPPRSICYAAFNNSIVDDFSEKYDWLVSVLYTIGIKLTFSTIHSLGNAACREAYRLRGFRSVNKYRVSDLLSAYWQKDLREVWKEEAENIQAIQELVALCKQTLVTRGVETDDMSTGNRFGPSDDDLDILAVHYGVTMVDRDKVFDSVRHLLRVCRDIEADGTGRIDFNDMIWLPVVNKLKMPEVFDLLLVDESQDLNRCQQELVLKLGKRIILVGDDKQAIYGFAGADTDSMNRMQGLLSGGVKHMHLTETRRCGKAIVAQVNRLVPDISAFKDNPPGKLARINIEELEYGQESIGANEEEIATHYSLGEADMVLCRVNAPLVSLAFRMLKANKRVNIKGRDIGDGLKAFIKKSKCENVSDFLVWLDLYQQQQAEWINKRRNPDAEALVTLEDRCTCLRVFADGAITIKEMYAQINQCFKGKVCPSCNKSFDEREKVCYQCKDGNNAVKLMTPIGTLLSSVHRAKGLESKRVFILRPELMPHPKAKSEWEKGQEQNLQYVAETRAIEELIYVEGQLTNKGGEDNG